MKEKVGEKCQLEALCWNIMSVCLIKVTLYSPLRIDMPSDFCKYWILALLTEVSMANVFMDWRTDVCLQELTLNVEKNERKRKESIIYENITLHVKSAWCNRERFLRIFWQLNYDSQLYISSSHLLLLSFSLHFFSFPLCCLLFVANMYLVHVEMCNWFVYFWCLCCI